MSPMLTHVPVLLRGEVGELGQMEGYREGVFLDSFYFSLSWFWFIMNSVHFAKLSLFSLMVTSK